MATITQLAELAAINGTTVVVNATQHAPTEEQIAAGVINLPEDVWAAVRALSTFSTLPTIDELEERAFQIILHLHGAAENGSIPENAEVMIGGAPFFMPWLHAALVEAGYKPVYAFSEHISEESVVNGEVVKTSRCVHRGFV